MPKGFYRILLVVLIGFAPLVAFAQLENAVGIWLFDDGSGDVAKDGSGNKNDGAIKGAKWVNGKVGGALEFNGSANYVEVKDSPSLDLETEVTMMCWFYWGGAGDGWQTFFSKGPMSGTNENWALFINTGSGYFHFILTPGGGRINLDSQGGVVQQKKWMHAAATYDGKTRLIYLDGKQVGTGAQSGKTTPNDAFLGLGWREASPHYWNGMLDEMAVFNKALTEKQINTLMNDGIQSLLAVQPQGKAAARWGELKTSH